MSGLEVILALAGLAAADDGVGHLGLGQHRVDTGLIQSNRVEGGEHTHVGHDGHIVFAVAVTVGRHIHHQRHMEAGTAVHHRLGVLGDLAIQNGGSLVV